MSEPQKTFRDAITGPCAKGFVGQNRELFVLPSQLLSQHSTYFNAALNGAFLESTNQEIVLEDENRGVFRTFAAWLYQGQLQSRDLFSVYPTEDNIEEHLVDLCVFADRRGVEGLQKAACTMLLSFFADFEVSRMNTFHNIWSLPKTDCINKLREFLILRELYVDAFKDEKYLKAFPSEFVIDLVVALRTKGVLTTRPTPAGFTCDNKFLWVIQESKIMPNTSEY